MSSLTDKLEEIKRTLHHPSNRVNQPLDKLREMPYKEYYSSAQELNEFMHAWDTLVHPLAISLLKARGFYLGNMEKNAEYLSYICGFEVVKLTGNRSGIYPAKLTVTLSNNDCHSIYHLQHDQEKYVYQDNKWQKSGAKRGHIYSYSTDPLDFLDFKALPHERPGKFEPMIHYGVELEVLVKTSKSAAANSVSDSLGTQFVILKSDGSLTEGEGFEIVTAPATLAYHRQAWDKFFKESAPSLKAFTTGCCGMHVHISRDAFMSPIHLGKVMAFWNNPNNLPFIQRIAGRYSQQYAAQSAENPMVNLLLNNGSSRDSIKPKILNKSVMPGGNKYRICNIGKKHTVEIRAFKGNVAKVGFFKNLEFTDAVVQFCKVARFKTPSAAEVQMMKAKHKATGIHVPCYMLTSDDFLQWLEKDKSANYKYLKLWLYKSGILADKSKKPTSKTPVEHLIFDDQVIAVA